MASETRWELERGLQTSVAVQLCNGPCGTPLTRWTQRAAGIWAYCTVSSKDVGTRGRRRGSPQTQRGAVVGIRDVSGQGEGR